MTRTVITYANLVNVFPTVITINVNVILDILHLVIGNHVEVSGNNEFSIVDDVISTEAIDFCALYKNLLCPNGKCVPLMNDYICQCDQGYTLSYDRKKCTS